MKQPLYLVFGVPGSGKTWTCEQLQGKFQYVPHDPHSIGKPPENYQRVLAQACTHATKPVLGESPFKISSLIEPMRALGIKVHPVFILEAPETVRQRYEAREKKRIPVVHLSRILSVERYAKEFSTFSGRSEEVLKHLQGLAFKAD